LLKDTQNDTQNEEFLAPIGPSGTATRRAVGPTSSRPRRTCRPRSTPGTAQLLLARHHCPHADQV